MKNAIHQKPADPFTEKLNVHIRILACREAARQAAIGYLAHPLTAGAADLRDEVQSRLHLAVMQAYAAFRENATCSYESFAKIFTARALAKMRYAAGRDCRLAAKITQFSAASANGLDYSAFSVREAMDALERTHPFHARILRLYSQGLCQRQVALQTGISSTRR